MSKFLNISNNETIFGAIDMNSTQNDTSFLNITQTLLLKQIHDYLILILLVCVMFAMGSSSKISQVLNHITSPVPLVIALICQFGLFPFCSYCLIRLLSIEPLRATGLLVLASSPGGVLSNIFTYFWSGDIPLSICLTTAATVVALIAMPFNMWFYGRNFGTESLVIPYKQMTFTLILITIPVFLGMCLNWKCPKYSNYITKIGSMAGFSIIIICQTLEIFIFPDIFYNIPIVLYIAVGLLPVIGLAIGYLSSLIFCLNYKIRKTIALEIAVKNVGSAITIITLSFPFGQLRQTILFPFLYTFSSLTVLMITTIVIKIYENICFKSSEELISRTEEDKRVDPSTKALIKRDNNNVNPIIIERRYPMTSEI